MGHIISGLNVTGLSNEEESIVFTFDTPFFPFSKYTRLCLTFAKHLAKLSPASRINRTHPSLGISLLG
jgi:molybdopterin-guanine dinucleotide biosynthesis protein A